MPSLPPATHPLKRCTVLLDVVGHRVEGLNTPLGWPPPKLSNNGRMDGVHSNRPPPETTTEPVKVRSTAIPTPFVTTHPCKRQHGRGLLMPAPGIPPPAMGCLGLCQGAFPSRRWVRFSFDSQWHLFMDLVLPVSNPRQKPNYHPPHNSFCADFTRPPPKKSPPSAADYVDRFILSYLHFFCFTKKYHFLCRLCGIVFVISLFGGTRPKPPSTGIRRNGALPSRDPCETGPPDPPPGDRRPCPWTAGK